MQISRPEPAGFRMGTSQLRVIKSWTYLVAQSKTHLPTGKTTAINHTQQLFDRAAL